MRARFILCICYLMGNVAKVKLEPIATLNRIYHKSGMHIEVETKVNVKLNLGQTCRAILKENVTSSFFVDQYEIKRGTGFYNPTYFGKNIDVELPSYLSTHHDIFVYADLTESHEMYQASFLTPWHMRYHEPSTKKYKNITIPHPQFYISCEDISRHDVSKGDLKIREPCNPAATKNLCTFIAILSNVEEDDPHLSVPVGEEEHSFIVTFTTLISTSICTLYILYIASSSK